MWLFKKDVACTINCHAIWITVLRGKSDCWFCEEKVNILKLASFWAQVFVQWDLAKVWSNPGTFSARVKFCRVTAIIKGIENGTLGAVFALHSLIYSISMFSLVFYNEKGVLASECGFIVRLELQWLMRNPTKVLHRSFFIRGWAEPTAHIHPVMDWCSWSQDCQQSVTASPVSALQGTDWLLLGNSRWSFS